MHSDINVTMSDVVYFFKILMKDANGVLEKDKFGRYNKIIIWKINKECFIFYFLFLIKS